jgi:hypothetical protein
MSNIIRPVFGKTDIAPVEECGTVLQFPVLNQAEEDLYEALRKDALEGTGMWETSSFAQLSQNLWGDA